MCRKGFTPFQAEFLKDEEDLIMPDDPKREELMALYRKSKITVEDMLREYTPDELRMLCERTKVRVKMTRLNVVWDAKKRFDAKKRLENKPVKWVNRMFEKAHRRRMVAPYTALEREIYKDIAALDTKKANLVRLDRWHRQRLRAARSNGLDGLNVLLSGRSQSESVPEMLSDSETEPPAPAPLESQPQSESDETLRNGTLQPDIQAPGKANSSDSGFIWEQAADVFNSESLSFDSSLNTLPEYSYDSFASRILVASTPISYGELDY